MKNEEIFKTIDKNLKKNKAELIEYSQTRRAKNGQKYKYYAQFIYEEYKLRTAKSIFTEVNAAGIIPPSVAHIFNIKHKIETYVENKKPLSKGDKKCWTEGCKNKIADGNHAYCKTCDLKHKGMSNYIDGSFHNELPCAY